MKLFEICQRCGGTGKIPGDLSHDGKTFHTKGCPGESAEDQGQVYLKSCDEGLILTEEGRHLMDFLWELKKRKFKPFCDF